MPPVLSLPPMGTLEEEMAKPIRYITNKIMSGAVGAKYEGLWKGPTNGGAPDQYGRWLMCQGELYEGELEFGQLTGFGTRWCSQGDVYVGELIEGVYTGVAMHWDYMGRCQVTKWHKGKEAGKGVLWSQDREQCWETDDGHPRKILTPQQGVQKANALLRLVTKKDFPQLKKLTDVPGDPPSYEDVSYSKLPALKEEYKHTIQILASFQIDPKKDALERRRKPGTNMHMQPQLVPAMR
eukprot:CAMPEP_0119316136 /NCGR_PEP_ID=MMETSP1333-20130426/38727_1 /TAXON_ID=418940 /ORGANISM="Scyphosphaera apsteinii, Strain RCC1455" /LENGTH=237 /DNA_ID=CAMNT_0007321711 /DNA_START=53 /DNA_END=766 /DNA_ORIENTATION=+